MTGKTIFPTVTGRDLTGDERPLPNAFEAPLSIVFVAFRREQQAVIDSWGPWLARVAAPAGIPYFEIPVLGRPWKLFRPAIDGGMAAAIRDLTIRRATITIYGPLSTITVPLGITDTSKVWIFLVGSSGEVLHTMTGPYSDEAATSLWQTVTHFQ
jgi:hypothetical protein